LSKKDILTKDWLKKILRSSQVPTATFSPYDRCCDVGAVIFGDEKINEMANIDIDITDLTTFNKGLGTSRGVGSIGVRNTKNLFEKTDVIVRSILSGAGL
jgi:hypothetical protein